MYPKHAKQKLTVHQKMAGDAVRIGKQIPYIHTLVELDATFARNLLRNYRKQTGVAISFSTYLLACCLKAIRSDTSIQKMYAPFNSSVCFDDIDIFYPTELNGDQPQVVSKLIRKADTLTLSDLQTKINSSDNVIDSNRRLFMKLPWVIRKYFYKTWMANPKTRKTYFGTVYFSSILNFSGDRRAWGIPIPMHGFGIFIGTMCDRLITTKEGVEKRDMVQVTLSVDHRVSNGGDMARFVHRLKHILEFEDLTQP